MSFGTTVQRGNELFSQIMLINTTPGAITTALVNYYPVTIPGVQVGDLVSWNIITLPASTLLTIANAYVSAPNTIQLGWTTEGGTVASPGAQQVLLEIARPENANVLPGLGALPTSLI